MDLSTISIEKLPEILNHLQTVFIPKWEAVRNYLVLFKIEAFADDISKYSEVIECKFLTEYALQLKADLDNVDLESLKVNIDYFPQILTQISEYLNQAR